MGVYKINSGIARYIQIFSSEKPKDDEGFTVLDPTSNKSINVYDEIVTIGREAYEGKIINKK